MKLKAAYENPNHPDHREVKRSINTLLGLPFIPLEDIVEIFVELRNTICSLVIPVWQYLDETYVRGRPARGRRRATPPLFPPSIWNCYIATLNQFHRTNNYVESWHSKFARLMATRHPNIWRFLEKQRSEQREIEQQIVQIRGGQINIFMS